jgi:hypothetical protein
MDTVKTSKRILLLTILISFILLLSACEELTQVSVDERINMFFNDLNAGNTSTIRGDHISPNSSGYLTVDADYWDTSVWAPANRPFTVTTSNIPDTTTVTFSVTSGGPTSFTFYMEEVDEDFWQIKGVQGYFGP